MKMKRSEIDELNKKDKKLRRTHAQKFHFNDLEMKSFNSFCEKYNIKNKAKLMREAIIGHILRKLDEDYPTLFPLEDVETKKPEIDESQLKMDL